MSTTPLKQTDRLFYLETPLGTDKLLIRSLRGTESISQLFHFELEMVSDYHDLPFDQLVGKNVTAAIKQSDDDTLRYFNAYVSRFSQATPEGRLAVYHAELVPWLWFLTLTKDCYIYQNKKIPDVIRDVFQRFGFQDYEMNLQYPGNYQVWDYCCQYRESAFNFVSRLMEIEGMFYFFKQENGKHQMVIGDSTAAHKPCPFQSQFRYEYVFGEGFKRSVDTVFLWRPQKAVRPGKYTHTEYNFEIPKMDLKSETRSTVLAGADPKYEIYDYPGEYEYKGEGEVWGRHRMEEQEVDHHVITGSSNCRSMQAGFRFKLVEHDRSDQNDSYVVTSLTHYGHEGGFLSGKDSGEPTYENNFTCIPAKVKFRPSKPTEKPLMLGSQTATVVGPKGEEIYTDKYGRVKVQFHWDRKGKRDEKSSCWIRVMQQWTGKNWGQIWIPRIGQEVIVDFLEGDADRPLITGCVYNAENMPPYKLPDNQTISGVKTRSSKGGGAANFNELYLEDKKGQELFLMHAEKDMDISVENDTTETIDRDRFLTVKRHQTELVRGDKHGTVQGEQREEVKGKVSRQVGGQENVKVGTNYALEAGGEIHLKAGTQIVLEAGTGITFLGPGGFINVSPAGIAVQGNMVWINSGMPSPPGGLGSSPLKPNVPGAGATPPAGEAGGSAGVPGAGAGAAAAAAVGGAAAGAAGAAAGAAAAVPPPPKPPTVTAKDLIDIKGTADQKDADLVAAELAKLPPEALQKLKDNKTRVVVCRGSMTEYRTDLKGVKPRGWPPGSTWDKVPGAHTSDRNEVVIATVGHGTKAGAHVPGTGEGHGSVNLVLHETGHALDHASGGSSAKDFLDARTKDQKQLSAYESQAGAAGQQETYAESLARYYGGDPGAAKKYPELTKYWQSNPLSGGKKP